MCTSKQCQRYTKIKSILIKGCKDCFNKDLYVHFLKNIIGNMYPLIFIFRLKTDFSDNILINGVNCTLQNKNQIIEESYPGDVFITDNIGTPNVFLRIELGLCQIEKKLIMQPEILSMKTRIERWCDVLIAPHPDGTEFVAGCDHIFLFDEDEEAAKEAEKEKEEKETVVKTEVKTDVKKVVSKVEPKDEPTTKVEETKPKRGRKPKAATKVEEVKVEEVKKEETVKLDEIKVEVKVETKPKRGRKPKAVTKVEQVEEVKKEETVKVEEVKVETKAKRGRKPKAATKVE
jgi:hypothetical protein